jgi:hypothetical protein
LAVSPAEGLLNFTSITENASKATWTSVGWVSTSVSVADLFWQFCDFSCHFEGFLTEKKLFDLFYLKIALQIEVLLKF